MNTSFTERAGSRMSVDFAAFFGSSIRHKFDYSLRAAFMAHRISGTDARALSRYFYVRCPMRQNQQPVERTPSKFHDRTLGDVLGNWLGGEIM